MAIQEGITRRDFVKGTGIAVAGAAAGSAVFLGGCSSSATAEGSSSTSTVPEKVKSIPPVAQPEKWDYETDIIVVGSGGAAGVAAVRSAQLGAKVIVLEKSNLWGGTTNCSEAWAMPFKPALPVAAALEFETVRPTALAHKDWIGARAIAAKQQEVVNWIQDYCGVIFSPKLPESIANMLRLQMGDSWSEEMFTMGVPIDPEDQAAGADKWHPMNGIGFTKQYRLKLEELGATIMMSTPATALVKDGKRIVGVQAKQGDKTLHIKGTVILACGGYCGNEEMLKYYMPERWYLNFGSYGGMSTNEGDGHRMAAGAGALLWAMDEVELYAGGVSLPLGKTVLYEAAKQMARQPSLVVNKFCQRYFNEATWHGDYVTGQAVQKGTQPFQKSYTILDDSCFTAQQIIDVFKSIICAYPIPEYDEQMQQRLKEGTVKKADTIEELAEMLDLDPAAFSKTLDEYNTMCDKGADELFFKPSMYMHALRTPPFYGVEEDFGGTALNSFGGLRTDADRRVFSTEWEIIPGLYAAGETAAYCAHNTNGMPTGYIAAEAAVADLGIA